MKNINGMFPNLSRAYEVALMCDQKINLIGFEYDNFENDFGLITNEFKGGIFSEAGKIHISLPKPNFDHIFSSKQCETVSDVELRVKTAKNNSKPNEQLNDSCMQLLKTAYERLSLNISDVKSIIHRASGIAQMENCAKIETQHIAESIQYSKIY